jgi:hypothetical protein
MIPFRLITLLTGPVGYTSFRWPLRAMAKYTHKTGIYATGTLFFLSPDRGLAGQSPTKLTRHQHPSRMKKGQ